MPKKGEPKTPGSGRKKGTPNKLTLSVQEFIESVLRSDDEASSRAREFLDKRDKTAAAVFLRMLEYRFGKPKETVEHTGLDGGPIKHTIEFGSGSRDGDGDSDPTE